MNIIYSFFILLLSFGMRIGVLFNKKIRQGWQGRKKSFSIAKSQLQNEKVIWMHAASLGEYEQGLPVLEQLKKQYPKHKILITFFSPSGYENVVKKQNIADAVCYLPLDFKSSVRKFVSLFQTEIFFTIKYDYWYHLLQELKKNKHTKTLVVSALFYKKQVFFKPYGKWFVEKLRENVDCFFHQTEESCRLAKGIGLEKSLVSGDTRMDRVKQIRERENFVAWIQEFKQDKTLIVFGSSWEAEEKVAEKLLKKNADIKIIIAPHDIKRQIFSSYPPQMVQKYSELTTMQEDFATEKLKNAKVLIIDCIGLLSKIYSYADIAVVGGGFHSAGLHNILEAATFGIPVLFGSHYKKNPEADDLVAFGGAKSSPDEELMVQEISQLIENTLLQQEMAEKSYQFIQKQPNATRIIMNKIPEI